MYAKDLIGKRAVRTCGVDTGYCHDDDSYSLLSDFSNGGVIITAVDSNGMIDIDNVWCPNPFKSTLDNVFNDSNWIEWFEGINKDNWMQGGKMKETPRFKIGDRVRQISNVESDGYVWDSLEDKIGKEGVVINTGHGDKFNDFEVRFDEIGTRYTRPSMLEHVSKSKNTRLITEKLVVNGQKMRKLDSFENVIHYNNLPEEYDGNPSYWGNTSPMITIDGVGGDGEWFNWCIGDTVTEEKFQEIVQVMKLSGERLAKINKKIKKEKVRENLTSEWHGVEVIEI